MRAARRPIAASTRRRSDSRQSARRRAATRARRARRSRARASSARGRCAAARWSGTRRPARRCAARSPGRRSRRPARGSARRTGSRHRATFSSRMTPEQLGDLVLVEARGRLVEHQDLERRSRSPARSRPAAASRASGCRAASRDRARARAAASASRAAARIRRQSMKPNRRGSRPEHDVLGDRQVGQQVDLLVDRADARPAGRRRASRTTTGSPSSRIEPASSADRAGDRLDQRRLARAVLAHQRVDLAREHPEVHVVERRVAREAHGRADRPRRPGCTSIVDLALLARRCDRDSA